MKLDPKDYDAVAARADRLVTPEEIDAALERGLYAFAKAPVAVVACRQNKVTVVYDPVEEVRRNLRAVARRRTSRSCRRRRFRND